MSLNFEPNLFIRYEILTGGQWVVYDIRLIPFVDISGLPNPVQVRFRTFENLVYSKYRHLQILHDGNPYYVGLKPVFGPVDPDNLQDEATTEDVIHEYGGEIAI